MITRTNLEFLKAELILKRRKYAEQQCIQGKSNGIFRHCGEEGEGQQHGGYGVNNRGCNENQAETEDTGTVQYPSCGRVGGAQK